MSRDKKEEAIFLDRKAKNQVPSDRNFILNNTSKTVLKNEDQYKFQLDQRNEEQKIEEIKPAFNLQPVEVSSHHAPTNEIGSKVKNSSRNSRIDDFSRTERDRSR